MKVNEERLRKEIECALGNMKRSGNIEEIKVLLGTIGGVHLTLTMSRVDDKYADTHWEEGDSKEIITK